MDVKTRFQRVSDTFGARVREVPADAWELPSPCAGWSARDIVRHLVEWVPPFLHDGAGIEIPEGPSVDLDPVGAWTNLAAAIQAILDAPDIADRRFEHPQAGSHRLDDAIAMFILGDVLIHTWDLARATGLDEKVDADEVAGMLDGLEPLDEMLRSSGHYGPRVEVDDGAGSQDRLLAFLGRRP